MTEVAALAQRYWDHYLHANALFAMSRGDLRHGERVEDLGSAGIADRVAELRSFAAEADAGDGDGVPLDDRVTLAAISATAGADASWLGPREVLMFPNHTIGVHTVLWNALPRQPYRSAEHGENAVVRYGALGPMIDQLAVRVAEGAAAGWAAHRHTVASTIAQLDAYLASPVDEDRLATARAPHAYTEPEAAAWRDRLIAALAESVRPAFARYRNVLCDDVLPESSPDDRPGLCWLDGGPELYAARVRSQTTLDLAAEDVHQIGLDTVAGLDEEYRELGGRVLGTADLAEVYRRLREDPDLRYTTGAEMVRDAEAVVARAAAAMGAAFHRSPAAGCVVMETDVGAAAFYQSPARDGSRPGTFFINTANPGSWGRFEIEALAFHEAIPGHHFERMGMLATDSLRATRLVVDTGLHAMGWSRQQAIDYMVANSPITPGHAADEVDRYLGMPGQALSYMIGRHEIVRLRRAAETALGGGFDLKGFHDEVLRYGAMPLPMLGEVVAAWAA